MSKRPKLTIRYEDNFMHCYIEEPGKDPFLVASICQCVLRGDPEHKARFLATLQHIMYRFCAKRGIDHTVLTDS